MGVEQCEAECPLCGTVVDEFDEGGKGKTRRPDVKCPTCDSLERHRGIWLAMQAHPLLSSERVRTLHVAPEPCIGKRLKALPNVTYFTCDRDPVFARVATDLTRMGFADGSFDLLLVSHVLEHIPDDLSAMRELRRVLRQGGLAVLAVPIWGPETREDLSITDPDERTRLYGQADHVRMYGRDGVFERRLTDAGFDVMVDPIVRDMDPALQKRYRVRAIEPVFMCTHSVPVVPSAPTMRRDAFASDRQVTMSWEPPAPSDAPLLGYVVTAYDGYYPELMVTFNSTRTTQTIGGLTNGVTYRFKVAAFNAVGTGDSSRVSNPVVPGS
jgi:SAM-dependent methyltransferase